MTSAMGSNPFVSSLYGNPNFNPAPVKTRSNTASESKSSKIGKPSQDKQNASVNRYHRKKNQTEGKVTMQVEEEEDLDEFSTKHVAAARYLRNHRLINEIFGDTVVPDVRNVVTTHRMAVLKKQVQSLTMHQKKLEAELQQIDEKFQTKKRKFLEGSEQFQEEMKKMCSSKPVDAAKYQKMVEQALEQLKQEQKQREELIKRQQEELLKKQQESNLAAAAAAAAAVADQSNAPADGQSNVQSGVESSVQSNPVQAGAQQPNVPQSTLQSNAQLDFKPKITHEVPSIALSLSQTDPVPVQQPPAQPPVQSIELAKEAAPIAEKDVVAPQDAISSSDKKEEIVVPVASNEATSSEPVSNVPISSEPASSEPPAVKEPEPVSKDEPVSKVAEDEEKMETSTAEIDSKLDVKDVSMSEIAESEAKVEENTTETATNQTADPANERQAAADPIANSLEAVNEQATADPVQVKEKPVAETSKPADDSAAACKETSEPTETIATN